MNEKSAFDILTENLVKRGIVPETHKSERQFLFTPSKRFLNTKFIIAEAGPCFFCAFDSFGAKAFTSNTYTGIYAEIGLKSFVDCYIYKKDRADAFLRVHKVKTGVKYIDSQLTVTSGSGFNPGTLLSEAVVTAFIELERSVNPLKILIQKDYPPVLNKAGGKLMVGLETGSWVYKEADLDLFLGRGMELIQSIREAGI